MIFLKHKNRLLILETFLKTRATAHQGPGRIYISSGRTLREEALVAVRAIQIYSCENLFLKQFFFFFFFNGFTIPHWPGDQDIMLFGETLLLNSPNISSFFMGYNRFRGPHFC